MKTYTVDNIDHYFSCEMFRYRLEHWQAASLNRNKWALAETIGVSKDTVDGWARGSHSPKDLEGVTAVASALGIDAVDLLSPAPANPASGKDGSMKDFSPPQLEAMQRVLHAFQKFYAIAEETNGFIFSKYPLACLPFGLNEGLVSDHYYYCDEEFDPTFISADLLEEQASKQLQRALEAEYLSLDRDLYWALCDHAEKGIVPIPVNSIGKDKGSDITVNEEIGESDELWFSMALGIRQAQAELYQIFDGFLERTDTYDNHVAAIL